MVDDKPDRKKEILKELLISEDDTLEQLHELVAKTKPFLAIEKESGRIILKQKNLTNTQQLGLYLIGKYFAHNLSLAGSSQATFDELSKELGIVKTTMSWPLGELVKNGFVRKPEEGKYEFVYHKIAEFLESLMKKHALV